MMNTFSKNMAVAVVTVATTVLSGYSSPTFAAVKSISKAQGEGFRACKALGRTGYTGIVKGKTYSGTAQRGGLWPFTIRNCFASKNQCEQYVSRVKNTVYGIENVTRTNCSKRV